jgi:hypothetical protein
MIIGSITYLIFYRIMFPRYLIWKRMGNTEEFHRGYD